MSCCPTSQSKTDSVAGADVGISAFDDNHRVLLTPLLPRWWTVAPPLKGGGTLRAVASGSSGAEGHGLPLTLHRVDRRAEGQRLSIGRRGLQGQEGDLVRIDSNLADADAFEIRRCAGTGSLTTDNSIGSLILQNLE